MLSELELLNLMLTITIMVIFVVVTLFMLLMMFRAFRIPRLSYPPPSPASALAKELMCPRCSSRELEPVGHYTIKCRGCGFMFSVGTPAAYLYDPSWWLWPIIWWPLFWAWPIVYLKKAGHEGLQNV